MTRTETGAFKLTSELLEKILMESNRVSKKPKLIIALKRNDEELFMVECEIKIEKKTRI